MEAESVKASAKPKRERAPWRPPEVTNRPATAEETPKPAADLAKLAVECGWETVVTYARGTTDSDQPKLVHSIAVRMQRGAQRAVAVWMSPVEMQVKTKKRKVATGEMETVTVTRKRKGEMVEVEVQRPIKVEVVEEVLEQTWTFDFAARLGRWGCRKSGLSGVMPVKLSSVDLRVYLNVPIQVDNASLPAEVWAAGMDTEMIEGLERLAQLFAGEEMADA